MKINLSFLKSLYRIGGLGKNSHFAHGEGIWRVSLVVLVLLALIAVVFDGYIFFFRIQAPAPDVSGSAPQVLIKSLDKSLIDKTQEIIDRRSDLLRASGDDLPSTDPFK